ncbi:MAG TPA: universal stress protein [Acidimicrobiales bacterium]|jgi:nucleotide-binding universal stress UspA family protein|nr:universal stress protein [Acidimicrobiales bacterium]
MPANEGTAEAATASERRRAVVVGVDGSEPSSRALAFAAEEARLRGASLRVVYAWSLPALSTTAYLPPEAFEGVAEDAERLVRRQVAEVLGDEPDVPVDYEIESGPPANVILGAAKDALLVVVGSRGRGGFAGLLLGSVSTQVAHHASCPVVIVRS